MKYPHSANHSELMLQTGWTHGAGNIWIEPGKFRRASLTGQRLAGSAIDLANARRHRLTGEYGQARAVLEFARDARKAMEQIERKPRPAESYGAGHGRFIRAA